MRLRLSLVLLLAAASAALAGEAAGPWLDPERGLAAAGKSDRPAIVWLEAIPPARELSAATKRREAFLVWLERAVPALEAVREERALAIRAPASATATAALATPQQRAEGLLVVVDWQGAPAGAIAPSSGTTASWERELKKLVDLAAAIGAQKRQIVERITAEVARAEADLARKEYRAAVERARPVAAEKAVRAPAIDRARRLVEEVHRIGKAEATRLREDHDQARKSGTLQRWAGAALLKIRKLKPQFPFKDVEDELSDIEALAIQYGVVPR